INCSFIISVREYGLAGSKIWNIFLDRSYHNHEGAKYLRAKAQARRFTPEQWKLIENSVNQYHLPARDILKNLRLIIFHFYNIILFYFFIYLFIYFFFIEAMSTRT